MEDEVNVGIVNWANMQPGIRTSSLVAAQMDCPRGLSKPTQKTKESEKDRDKLVCATYNKCLTKNKCEYEITYPDRTCQRKHECSWCKTTLGQSNKHQAWECKKKEAANNA